MSGDAVAKLVTKRGGKGAWISTAKALPPVGTFVIWERGDGLCGEGYRSNVFSDTLYLCRTGATGYEIKDFKWWMPFPEPPEVQP